MIDPVTATLGPSIVVGGEPRKVAVSDDGQFAYVGLHGPGAVRRVDLATFTAEQSSRLGEGIGLSARCASRPRIHLQLMRLR